MSIEMRPIGTVSTGQGFRVLIDKEFAPGLLGLEGFSHVMILWHADKVPAWDNTYLTADKPYRKAPDKLGIFATRSPYRPNSVCVSIAQVCGVDRKKGVLELTWVDAEDGSPVIDIKPYHPSSDRIRDAKLPDWCSHWPSCYEVSGDFPWDKEFLF